MKHGKTLLVVDDDEEVLELLRVMLAHEGFNVISAASAETALEILENQDADLIISDLRMPGLSGIEFLHELREWDASLPVIFVSGWGKEKDWEEALQAHVSAMISKPFHRETILKAVRKALQEKEALSTT